MTTSHARLLIPLVVLATAMIAGASPSAGVSPVLLRAQAPAAASTDGFHDSHFHLTNYVQQGIEAAEFLNIMGTRVGRSTLFGIPLQQQW